MTATKTKPITKARAVAEIKRLVAENPDRVNPMEDGICLYHKGRGRNITRCIVGQLGYDLGLPTPLAEEGYVDEVVSLGTWKGLFTPAATEYLSAVQTSADVGPNVISYYPVPRRWGEIPKSVINGRA